VCVRFRTNLPTVSDLNQTFPNEKANDFIREKVLDLIERNPGISDGALAGMIFGLGAAGTLINNLCRQLAAEGLVDRRVGSDSLLRSWIDAANGEAKE
jgi:hypothetical protein